MLGTILAMFIGVAVVFLGLSLFASAIQEVFAQLFQLRAKSLRSAVGRLLPAGGQIGDKVYNHPLIAGHGNPGRLPSYIPSTRFAQATIDVLNNAKALSADGPGALGALFRAAGGDVSNFETQLAAYFDEAMDRLSGQYKRMTHMALAAIGLGLAVGLNIDTVQLVHGLSVPGPQQAALAASADDLYGKIKAAPSGAPAGSLDQAIQAFVGQYQSVQAITSLDADLGWSHENLAAQPFFERLWTVVKAVPDHWLGWLLTALGVSMGSGFWFNTLGSLLALRGTGPKPAKAAADPAAKA